MWNKTQNQAKTMQQLIKRCSAVSLSIALLSLLAACGGSDALVGDGNTTGTDDIEIRLGSGFGSDFSEGVIEIGESQLSAGGSTSLRVVVVDQNGDLVQDAVTVRFNSNCVAQGLASIETPVSTVNGAATSTYTAQGCSSTTQTVDDEITATVSINEVSLTATGTVSLLPTSVGSIQFLSASPEVIALRGTSTADRPETSVVSFRVLNEAGGASFGRPVCFFLNTDVGDLRLINSSATTGADGTVQTTVRTGTVSTPVRVIAEVYTDGDTNCAVGNGTGLRTQSSQLVVSTGFPDQNSTDLVATTLNVEGFSISGIEVPVTIFLADRFNNPPPDGTTVSFTTEGGAITPTCQTINGTCSVTWRSQEPRPNNGRSTILARAIGEESFRDLDGDFIFDNGEQIADTGESGLLDVPEAFLDRDENGLRNPNNEEFFDFNSDGEYTPRDNRYQGSACDSNGTAIDCDNVVEGADVRSDVVIVMSKSVADIDIRRVNNVNPNCVTPDGVNSFLSSDQLAISIGGCYFEPCDHYQEHGPLTSIQVMPSATSVSFDSSNGEILGNPAFNVTNTNAFGPSRTFVSFVAEEDEPLTGPFAVNVTSPSGLRTTAVVNITDDTDNDGCGDDVDVCPNISDADQADSDSDGTGDACSDDDEGDAPLTLKP